MVDRPFTLAVEDVDAWLACHYPPARRITDRRAQLQDELAALDQHRSDLLARLDQLDQVDRGPAGPDLSRP